METCSALLALCAWNSPVTGEFPSQRPVTRSFDVFVDLRLHKRLSKQSRRRWFETPSQRSSTDVGRSSNRRYHCYWRVNSLWPNYAIWLQIPASTLAQVMACCLTAPSITWTSVDWSSVKSSDIHIRAISQGMPQPLITKICLKITCLKFHSNFPGANELIS